MKHVKAINTPSPPFRHNLGKFWFNLKHQEKLNKKNTAAAVASSTKTGETDPPVKLTRMPEEWFSEP
jgi:hypothetical protein